MDSLRLPAAKLELSGSALLRIGVLSPMLQHLRRQLITERLNQSQDGLSGRAVCLEAAPTSMVCTFFRSDFLRGAWAGVLQGMPLEVGVAIGLRADRFVDSHLTGFSRPVVHLGCFFVAAKRGCIVFDDLPALHPVCAVLSPPDGHSDDEVNY